MSQKFEKMLDQLVKLYPKYIDLSLNRILKLLDKLGNPHTKLPKVIHIAGTNGKGSLAHILSAVLQTAGLKIGLYTSPHLLDFRERIRIHKRISRLR